MTEENTHHNQYVDKIKAYISEIDTLTKKTVIILFIAFALMFAYSFVANNESPVLDNTESGVTATNDAEISEEKSDTSNSISPSVPRSVSSVEADFIIDADTVNILLPTLHVKSTINISKLCKEILDTSELKDNIYYYVQDEYLKLNNTYGSYKKSIKSIGTTLDGISSDLQFIKKECADIAFLIDS